MQHGLLYELIQGALFGAVLYTIIHFFKRKEK